MSWEAGERGAGRIELGGWGDWLGDWLGGGKSLFSLGFSRFLGRGITDDRQTDRQRINPFRALSLRARLENIYIYIYMYIYIYIC